MIRVVSPTRLRQVARAQNGLVTDLSGATVSDDIPTVTIIPEACLDAIAITKAGVFNDVDTNGCSTASVDTVTYTFTVTNQGNTLLHQ